MKRLVLLLLLTACQCHPRTSVIATVKQSPTGHRSRLTDTHSRSRPAGHRVGAAPDAAPSPGSLVPSAWMVPAWWIDPSNTTGCASDGNTGTSATCSSGGVGPLASWRGLDVVKWGCLGSPSACPRLLQNTTITYLSSQTTNDPVIFTPSIENGSFAEIQCPLGPAQAVATGTLGPVTPKNRPANQALVTTFNLGDAGGALQQGVLAVNTTHPSLAWPVRDTGGGAWLVTQPIQPITSSQAQLSWPLPVEVDTWATSDVITLYAPIQVPLLILNPLITQNYDSGFGLYVLDCAQSTSSVYPAATLTMGQGVIFLESSFSTQVVLTDSQLDNPLQYSVNSLYMGGIQNSYPVTFPLFFAGGTVGTQTTLSVSGLYDCDFMFAGQNYENYISTNTDDPCLGQVYVDAFTTITGGNPNGLAIASEPYECGSPGMLYGPGSVNVMGVEQVSYVGNAVTSLPLSGGLYVNGQTTACTATESGVVSCGIPLTAGALDMSVSGSGFGGTAFRFGGGSYARSN